MSCHPTGCRLPPTRGQSLTSKLHLRPQRRSLPPSEAASGRVIALPEARLAWFSRATASRSTAGDRGRRVSSQSCTGCATTNCRSASRCTSKASSNVSSGGRISTEVIARRRLDRSGNRTGQRDGAARAASSSCRPRSRAVFSKWNSSVSSNRPDRRHPAPTRRSPARRPDLGVWIRTARLRRSAPPRCAADATCRTPPAPTAPAAAPASRYPARPAPPDSNRPAHKIARIIVAAGAETAAAVEALRHQADGGSR